MAGKCPNCGAPDKRVGTRGIFIKRAVYVRSCYCDENVNCRACYDTGYMVNEPCKGEVCLCEAGKALGKG